jgi:energy-coupling factor transporter ATP-binding protein EcfA2
MAQNSGNQSNLGELFQKVLVKNAEYLIPAGLVAIALSYVTPPKRDWQSFILFLIGAAIAFLGLRIGRKLLPYFDKALDWILRKLEECCAELTDRTEGTYYRYLKADCEDYEGRGFNAGGLSLEAVYVPLKLSENAARNVSQDIVRQQRRVFDPQAFQKIGELILTIGSPKSRCRHLVILGAPGSGKSTLMRHITLMYAIRKRRRLDPQVPKLHPIILRLREVYELILEQPERSLADLTTQFFQGKSGELSTKLEQNPQWFEKRLRRGRCLVILDGLDEIVDDTQRQTVSQWVDRQLKDYYETPFILTSRPDAYKKSPLYENAIELEVQPFSTTERNTFIHNWCFDWRKSTTQGKVNTEKARQRAEDLISQIDLSPTLRLMATNPLLLSLMARTHVDKGKLASKRVDLYGDVCQVLLEGRQRYRKTTEVGLSAKRKQGVLQHLALEMTKAGMLQFTLDKKTTKEGTYAQAKALLEEELNRVPKNAPTPEEFVGKDEVGVRELLSDRQQEGLYEFAHRTFQEYLTAAELKRTGQIDCLLNAFAAGEQALAWWRETIRFYAAQADTTAIIEAALKEEHRSVSALALAYECLNDTENLDPETQQKLEHELDNGLRSSDPEEFRLAARVLLSVRLNRLNLDMGEPQVTSGEVPEIEDSEYVTWAEYRLIRDQILLREMAESERSMPLPNRSAVQGAKQPVADIDIWDVYKLCSWLSQMTRKQFGEDAQYRPKLPYKGRIKLIRFRVPERYQTLAHYLSSGQWEKADEETSRLIFKGVGKRDYILSQFFYLSANSIKQFPKADLRLIDFLWVTYSNGRFGFSVQKQIWVEEGGKLDFGKNKRAARMAFAKMSDRNGWRVNGKYIYSSEQMTFDASSKQGHLPSSIARSLTVTSIPFGMGTASLEMVSFERKSDGLCACALFSSLTSRLVKSNS